MLILSIILNHMIIRHYFKQHYCDHILGKAAEMP